MANLESEVSVSQVAIVGDGIGALITLAVLVHSGMPSHKITIYGDSPHPLNNLQRYAIALGQDRMRSESSGHFAPVDFPGLAWVDACRSYSPWPLIASLFDRYNPPVALLLAQADSLADRYGFHQRKVPTRISQILRGESKDPSFALLAADGSQIGVARHVVLALGHAELAWPEVVRPWQRHSSVAHAYSGPSLQTGERVAVVGSGLAAAHLWSLGIMNGAQVTALHRRPLRYQQLNAPRSTFSAVGIDAYRRLSTTDRLATLRQLSHGSFPWRFAWQWQWRRARLRGQLRSIQGELATLEPAALSTGKAFSLHLNTGETIEVDKLVCATGFITAALSYPLIAQMVAAHGLFTIDNYLAVSDDFVLPPLSEKGSICGVVGNLARWTFPAANTFAGIKYAARRLTPQLMS
jgi:cation diffusion facilitator CzcD-associated flavoprotein CzcO